MGKLPVEQWGERKVRVKQHIRDYGRSRGKVTVNQYSAECPDSGLRKRLKHIWGDVYEIESGQGGYTKKHYIEIKSGNEIFGAIWQVRSDLKQLPSTYSPFNTPPPNFEIVSKERFAGFNSLVKYGTEYRSFIVPMVSPNTLHWTVFFTNELMNEGVATAWNIDPSNPKNNEFIYAIFTECKHEYRQMTPEEITSNHLHRGRGLSNTMCSKCGKIRVTDSTD